VRPASDKKKTIRSRLKFSYTFSYSRRIIVGSFHDDGNSYVMFQIVQEARSSLAKMSKGAKREQGRGKREEGRGKREEGRGKRDEGRGKREEGRGKRDEGRGKREGKGGDAGEIAMGLFDVVISIRQDIKIDMLQADSRRS